ncbi:MAG: YheT family hydrolase [Saprospiraceae bacterium]
MPLIQNSTYRVPNFIFKNCHINTIYPSQIRKVEGIDYKRERITTPDDDFIDLDWLHADNEKVVIVCHGLEGGSDRQYVKGMAKYFHQKKWSICAYNYRGCSGEPNRQIKAYHSGATDDLELVIQHILDKKYKTIILVGFSLGGNLVLKYTGENGQNIYSAIKKTIALSVPCHLESSSEVIQQPKNWIYMKRFAVKLRKKVIAKKDLLIKQGFDYEGLLKAKKFEVFDELFTSKAHGFDSRIDYYTKCSAVQFLPNVTIPTLLINAKDDPFLSQECFPIDIAKKHDLFHLEMPDYGGHVGFMTFNKENVLWSEKRTFEFVNA